MNRSFVACLVAVVLGACSSQDNSLFSDGGARAEQASSGASGTFGGGPSSASDASATAELPATDVEAVVTTDNAFSFGYGDAKSVGTFIRGTASNGPEIFDCPVGFGPEPYTVPAAQAPRSAFLYIVAWADPYVTQGALAQFKRVGGGTIYSGDANWQVCATGKFFDISGPGPDQGTVSANIESCNQGPSGGTSSKGWVSTAGSVTAGAIGKLAVGEANDDAGGAFPIVCQKDSTGRLGIDAQAKWMWFDPLDGESPFMGNEDNRTKTFLIFRLSAGVLPPPLR
jgi:hypothetical protein